MHQCCSLPSSIVVGVRTISSSLADYHYIFEDLMTEIDKDLYVLHQDVSTVSTDMLKPNIIFVVYLRPITTPPVSTVTSSR